MTVNRHPGRISLSPRRQQGKTPTSFVADRGGIAAVEFAMVAPVFCLLLAGAVDLGAVLFAQFGLNNAIDAGAAYAQLNASQADSANGQTLANNVATVVENSQGSLDDSVVVNNGPATTAINGLQVTSGVAANADSCYCPTSSGGVFIWGLAIACGATCPGANTGYAGKFITISATMTYTPLFSNYGVVQNGTISSWSVVQVK